MIHIVILENNGDQRASLVGMVGGHPRSADFDVTALSDAAELEVRVASDKPVDILITDINLADDEDDVSAREASCDASNGIDLVSRLFSSRSRTQVVYVTGYDCYHMDAYETEHACFLLKPVEQEQMDRAIDLALGRRSRVMGEPLLVREAGGERVVCPHEISYIESDRRFLLIHLGRSVVRTYGKLANLEERLPERFVRCHKSFLVNVDAIAAVHARDLVLVTGDVVPVSQSCRKSTRDAVRAFVRAAR